MTAINIEFHGVRGSMATPGAATAEVGGNTSCVELSCGDTRIVLDAGTGLRRLGQRLVRGPESHTTILLSHVHWDHIQGVPFFPPVYVPGHTVELMSGPNGFMPLAEALRRQMSPPFFPVSFDDVADRVSARDLSAQERFTVGGAEVTALRLNHPDPVYGYRVDYRGTSVVYATDTEHYSCVDPKLLALARGADLLIYDAQYTPEEYPSRVGWGHSTYQAAAELATSAGVGSLALFHHDPARDDAGVAEIELRARELFSDTIAAREGCKVSLSAGVLAEAA